jgi:hypothetical protein
MAATLALSGALSACASGSSSPDGAAPDALSRPDDARPDDRTSPPPADAAPETGTPSEDASTPSTDVTNPDMDATSPPADATSPPADATSPPMDVTSPPMDVTSPPADVTSPPMDVTRPPMDASAPMDVSSPPRDAASDAPPDAALEVCSRPGTIERVRCPACGTRERFCNVMGFWEYGACTGDGICVAGTSRTIPCGRCGTRLQRCSDTCVYVDSACMGEMGDCDPGQTRRTTAGCPAGQSRLLRCAATTCTFTEIAEACRADPPADVTILIETTGSIMSAMNAAVSTVQSRLATPLLALPDTSVGVSYFADFPMSNMDRPFEGGVEPITDGAMINARIATRPTFNGGDMPEATLEALNVLAGGTPHPSISRLLTCSAGRVAGGCWRGSAQRFIVMITDSPVHLGPDPATGAPINPYGIAVPPPGPVSWMAVRESLMRQGVPLLVMDMGNTSSTTAQLRRMVTDLGQPASDVFDARMGNVTAASDAVVARIRALRGL